MVVFRHPVSGEDYVKRLIGLPGDRVQMIAGELLLNGDIHADAAEIDLPVTVVVGGADTVTTPEGCRKVADSFAHSRFEILPGLGHASYVEGPDAFNAVLAEHLDEYQGGAA